VKVDIFIDIIARRIVVPVFFYRINCEKYLQVILGQIFFRVNWRRKSVWLVSARLSYCPHCTYAYAGFVRCLHRQLSVVIFGQHFNLILILVILSSGLVWRAKYVLLSCAYRLCLQSRSSPMDTRASSPRQSDRSVKRTRHVYLVSVLLCAACTSLHQAS
jgi:hypothetical protein